MKINVKSYLWLVFAGLIGLSSCSSDEETVPAPTLTFTLNGAKSGSFNSEETIEFKMDLNASNDFTSLKGSLVYTKADNSQATVIIKDANNGDKAMDYTKNSDISNFYKGAKIVKVAIPADAKVGAEWTITVSSATSGGTTTSTFKGKVVNTWTAKLLGAQLNSNGSYFKSSTGEVLSGSNASAAPAGVDITYAAIGSPLALPVILSYSQRSAEGLSGVPASGAESTYFVETTLQPADFLSSTKSWTSCFTGAMPTSTSPQKVTVAKDKIYAFKNTAGKMGLIHIQEVIDGTDGSVTINVKAEN
jgi:hypothetical protein